jgi:hypothetical protein
MASGGREALRAAELVLAYRYGRPVQSVNGRVIRSVPDLTDEELQALMAEAEASG